MCEEPLCARSPVCEEPVCDEALLRGAPVREEPLCARSPVCEEPLGVKRPFLRGALCVRSPCV